MARQRNASFVVVAAMIITLFLTALPVFGAPAGTAQEGIQLPGGNASYYHVYSNLCELICNASALEKGVGIATTTTNSAGTFAVQGALTISNNGSLPTSIGSIVINLQKPNNPELGSDAQYVSVASVIADVMNGDAAAAAIITAAASGENAATNAAWGTNNYSVFGPLGIFVETEVSGSLILTEADGKTPWAITSEQSIPVGQSLTLLYVATFDVSALPPVGTPLRVEALVTSGEEYRSTMNVDMGCDGTYDECEDPVSQQPLALNKNTDDEVLPPVEADVPVELVDGDFVTYSQGGYGGSGTPYNLLAANFASIYPTGVEVGIPGAGGFSMLFTSAAAVNAYLPAGGKAKPLTADATNPTKSATGQFGGQVLALKLNIALSDASVTPAGFGDLYYTDPTSSLNGQTVRQILGVAEIALGGGALPAGYDYAGIAGLCEHLDVSFDNGVITDWAKTNLSKTP